jgi:hypothetical protein
MRVHVGMRSDGFIVDCCCVLSVGVHDLHIWSVSVGKPSLSVHLQCQDHADDVLVVVNKMCASKYNITHSTIQIERLRDSVDCNVPVSLDKVAAQSFSELGIVPQPTRY